MSGFDVSRLQRGLDLGQARSHILQQVGLRRDVEQPQVDTGCLHCRTFT